MTDSPSISSNPSESTDPAVPASPAAGGVSWRRRLFFLVILFCAISSSLLALAFYNHNKGPSIDTRGATLTKLDAAIAQNDAWLKARAEGMESKRNPALIHMANEMSKLRPSPLLDRVVNDYRLLVGGHFWQRMVDPNANTAPLPARERNALMPYQRWFVYAMDPGGTPISDADKASLWDPEGHRGYELTHQLFAHYFYLFQNPHDEKTKRMIRHLGNRIALEADRDFKITDLSIQRILCLLMTGRPELVKPRWVERVLANQLDDGGWRFSWHGWGPGWRTLQNPRARSHQHPTVQAAWVIYLARYAFPEWIDKHYPASAQD